ncbi:aldehyde dehydrogenase family protein [Kribbella sp. NPDC050124]|uniref:aldehyde dehydrogenase family protein n=1 Tax=Kribbella sp. NPDC050124 TaxID=3364114 RepID=UPI0037A6F64C
MFIGGVWREASDGRTIDVLNPATEEVVAQAPNASDADLDDALAAAASGFAPARCASRRAGSSPSGRSSTI